MTVKTFLALRMMECLLILGPSFLLGALGFATRDVLLIHNGVSTSGTIEHLIPASNAPDAALKTEFTFSAIDGHSYTVLSDLQASPATYNIGDHVPVIYKAADPSDASIASLKEMWRGPVALAIGGAIALAAGLFLRRQNWRAYLPNNAPQQSYVRNHSESKNVQL